MKTLNRALVWLVPVLFISITTSQAALMSGAFKGTVTGKSTTGDEGYSAFISLGVSTSDLVSGYFQYESTQEDDSNPGDATFGQYHFDPAAPANFLQITIGSNTWISGTSFNGLVYDNHPVSSSFQDRLGFWSNSFSQFPGVVPGESMERVEFNFKDSGISPGFLQSDSLPDKPVTFPVGIIADGYIHSDYVGPLHPDGVDDFWQIDFVCEEMSLDPVPVPGALWLLGSGLIGLIGLRRKLKK